MKNKIIRSVAVFVIVTNVIFLFNVFQSYDNTDDQANKERSGLSLYTDHLTGCQYLKAGLLSGITPRLYSDGKQVCGNAKPQY